MMAVLRSIWLRDAGFWIDKLGLSPHREGGFFRQTHRAVEEIEKQHLPERFLGDRPFYTSIYYLLKSGDFSAFHRIKSDEIWHYHYGDSLTVHVIDPQGGYSHMTIGKNVDQGDRLQGVVPAERTFGALVEAPDSYCLVSCTVSPGFDYRDFEIPTRENLLAEFPQHRGIIERLTR